MDTRRSTSFYYGYTFPQSGRVYIQVDSVQILETTAISENVLLKAYCFLAKKNTLFILLLIPLIAYLSIID